MNTRMRRVLIIEDEAMLALALEQDLIAEGYEPVGPFRNLAAARRASVEETFDIAILDINLNGELVYPVAEELTARGIPFLFVSGYGAESIPEPFRGFPQLPKPYDSIRLLRKLKELM